MGWSTLRISRRFPRPVIATSEARRLIEGGVERAGATLEHRRLRRAFDADAHRVLLRVRPFPRSSWTSTQLEALRSARAALALIEGIEFGYRAWMLGDTPPESTLGLDDDAWARAAVDREAEVLELRAVGRSGGWQGVHRWQQELARRRGSRPSRAQRGPRALRGTQRPHVRASERGWIVRRRPLRRASPEWWRGSQTERRGRAHERTALPRAPTTAGEPPVRAGALGHA